MSLGFSERITYSPEWSDSGKEWSQVEHFLREEDLTRYLATMEWRIIKNERLEPVYCGDCLVPITDCTHGRKN